MPTTAISVEAVRQQLEQLGRGNVPKEVIATFLSDLGVEPDLGEGDQPSMEEEEARTGGDQTCSSPSARGSSYFDEEEEEDEYENDFENDENEGFHSSKVSGGYKASGYKMGPRYKKNSPDSPLASYPENLRRERNLSASRSRECLSTRMNKAAAVGQPAKTDRVARYQRTQMSWKSCSSVQSGTKRRPAQNFHKLFAAQHAQSAKATKRAVQQGRKNVSRASRDYVTPDLKRRDNVRLAVRQNLRQTSE